MSQQPPAFAAWWTLARPAMLPLLWLMLLCGFGLAHWESALSLRGENALLPLFVAWAFLHAGALWLNAALDQDQGAVLFGRAVPVPPSAGRMGLLALALAPPIALLAHPLSALCAAGAALLGLLYSHPATAWKGHPLLGPLVNGLGYGLLTPLAGHAPVLAPLTGRTLALLCGMVLAMLGLSLLAQVGQGAEDRARGYRTLAARAGDGAALQGARLCMGAGGALICGLAAVGLLPRLMLILAAPLALLLAWMGRGPAPARVVRALVVLALLALALALIDHRRCLDRGGKVAGQCTAVVPAPAR